MKVAISFVDTADVAAKPQDRLRFSFGGAAAQKRTIRCDDVKSRYAMYITIRPLKALWRLKALNALKAANKKAKSRRRPHGHRMRVS